MACVKGSGAYAVVHSGGREYGFVHFLEVAPRFPVLARSRYRAVAASYLEGEQGLYPGSALRGPSDRDDSRAGPRRPSPRDSQVQGGSADSQVPNRTSARTAPPSGAIRGTGGAGPCVRGSQRRASEALELPSNLERGMQSGWRTRPPLP